MNGPARLAVAFFVCTTAMLVAPVFSWFGNHVHPRVFGLPWSLVYNLLVIAINFSALLWLYLGRSIDGRDA